MILENKALSKRAKAAIDIIASLMIAVLFIGGYHYLSSIGPVEKIVEDKIDIPVQEFKFGFDTDEYYISKDRIKTNQFLGDILNDNGISYQDIARLEKKAKDVFSVRKIKAGKNYHIIKRDSCTNAIAFVYEPDPLRYVLYDFRDSVDVKVVDRDFHVCMETAAGKIESSLWNAMIDQDIDLAVIDLMEDALGSQVDFYHAQKNDEFKLIYERKFVDNEPVALGDLVGAYYKNSSGDHYSYFFKNEKYTGYYDGEGRPTKKAFLRAPVRYSRISSRYNRRRFHPVKKRTIPHLGTDYAAPYGTPIRAVADGVIVKASYTRNNGKYVKIKHDRTYQTQYLHMQNFGKNIRPGVRVQQGQTIGYVGSTGLATGPHVCFRFWKNGHQVDHFRENFPPPEPMNAEDLPFFYQERDQIKVYLDQIGGGGENFKFAESKPNL